MSTVKLKRSAVPGKIPGVGALELGEVAINTHDGKMYLKKDANGAVSVVEVGRPDSTDNVLYVSQTGKDLVEQFNTGTDFTSVDVFGGIGGDLGFSGASQSLKDFATENIIIGAELEIFDNNTSQWISVTVDGFGYLGQTGPVQGSAVVFDVDISVSSYDVTALRKVSIDSNRGKTISNSFLTIEAAIDSANTGTTIFVKSGDYTLNNANGGIEIPANVSIVGDNLRTTSVKGVDVTKDLLYVNEGCYLTNLTFKDMASDAAAVSFPPSGAGNIQTSPYVENCTAFTVNGGVGMRIDGDLASGLKSMVSDSFTQINGQQGGANPNAVVALTNNKQWIQDETIGYINAQIAANNSPYSTSFTYDQDKCFRDVGLIVDHLIKDLDESVYNTVNANSIISAKLYYGSDGTSRIIGQEAETADSIAYVRELCQDAIIKTAPAQTYSATSQDTTHSTAEAGTEQQALDNIQIIIDVINGGPNRATEPYVTNLLDSATVTTTGGATDNGDGTYTLNANSNTDELQWELNLQTGKTYYFDGNWDRQVYMNIELVDANGSTRLEYIYSAAPPFDTSADPGPQPASFTVTQSGTATLSMSFGLGTPPVNITELWIRETESKIDSRPEVSGGGVGVHLLNSGYAQLVSIFTVSCHIGVLAESGGQCSLTNSNCSFGNYGLRASGAGPSLYTGTVIGSATANVDTTVTIRGATKPRYGDVMQFQNISTYYTVENVSEIQNGDFIVTFRETLVDNLINGLSVSFHQRSLIAASSITFEYVGTGVSFYDTPQSGAYPIQQLEVEQDTNNQGQVYFTSTDQRGDFRIGGDLAINRTDGIIEGETFDRSLFAIMTPYILALEGQ